MLVTPTKAKASVAVDPRWVTSIVLRALVQLAPKKGDKFTTAALATVTPDLTAVRRQRAITKLLGLQFITYKRHLVGPATQSVYTVTAEGAAAIGAVGQGAMLMAGPHRPRPGQPETFRARLWALLRIRKVLGAEEAVQLLIDAGDPKYISKRGRANEYLRRWQMAKVVELSAQVGPRGQKRYVLVTDPGPAVPAFIPPITAAQAKAAP